jgi:CheY-like chemotaxis protein
MLELRVSDDGIGIAADALPRLFTMFAQIEESASRSEGGLGIGLALVKGLVDLHGGSIDAASDGLGRGSTFTVRLPLARHVPAEHTQVGDVRAAGTARRRVLVVDDNHDAAASLGMLLELGGHDVRVAHGGRAALALAQTFRPDLALLDIGMPDMSGIDVARTLRREPWGGAIVLVALTGWGQDEDRRRTLEAGFVHHLTKPVDPEQIESLLRQGPTTGVRAASSV